jgi:hypothetical protein
MKDETTQGILTVARGVLADLDVAVVLERVLESARDVTAAGLYLTDKRGGEPFSQQDEGAVLLLAEFAGVAIDHARRYSGAENHRRELKQTVNALEATIQIARAPGGQTDLESILELVAKRGRALVSARALIVQLCDGPRAEGGCGRWRAARRSRWPARASRRHGGQRRTAIAATTATTATTATD